MREKYSEKKLGAEKLAVISKANTVIADFQRQGFRMTLRQLYYQFVSKNWITNEDKSYKNLAATISDGRLCGLIDWNAIEDRGRVPDVQHHYDDIDDMMARLKHAASGYVLDKWLGQDTYVELWVEKQALAGVLEPLARRHHVTLMVNKGYSSQSAMYESAQRFREGMGTTGERAEVEANEDPWYELESERDGLLLYLGDHDPSGEDMVRDIRDRLATFGCGPQLTVQKVALNMDQVRQYNCPPQPLKRKNGQLSDARGAAYAAEHGVESWEVDALSPAVLSALVTKAIRSVIDDDVLDELNKREEEERTRLSTALAKLKLRAP